MPMQTDMIVWVDSREKPKAVKRILSEFNQRGIKWFVSKLPVGDYQALDNPMLVIDRKQNLAELCGNVCQQHARFRAEMERANEYGIRLVLLVEHGGDIKSLPDVIGWTNPRLKESPMAVSGERLYKILSAMSSKYGVDIQFCDKKHTGQRIIEILEGGRTNK